MPQIRGRDGHSHYARVDGDPGMFDLGIRRERHVSLQQPAAENDPLPGEFNGNLLGTGHLRHRSKVCIDIEPAIGLGYFNQRAMLNGRRGAEQAACPLW